MEPTEKKEWKWPLGIFIGYAIFVTATLSFVFFTFTQKTDLVVQDYYGATLTYQDHIDKMVNANLLDEPFASKLNGSMLELQFPTTHTNNTFNGKVVFYRPSGSDLDFSLSASPNEVGFQQIDLTQAERGLWKLHVEWTANGVDYFSSSSIYLR